MLHVTIFFETIIFVILFGPCLTLYGILAREQTFETIAKVYITSTIGICILFEDFAMFRDKVIFGLCQAHPQIQFKYTRYQSCYELISVAFLVWIKSTDISDKYKYPKTQYR